MGAVFLAREQALKRLVAIKVLAPRLAAIASARKRFTREAQAAARIAHPNVIQVYVVGETVTSGLPYMVMQYVAGQALDSWAREHGPVTERAARRILGEVAAGLAGAHDRDLVHRDVKPGNILVEEKSGRVYVVDFGLAAAVSEEATSDESKITNPGFIVGTAMYMSPEQGWGDRITTASDIYSFGLTAYQFLAGVLPYSSSSPIGWRTSHVLEAPKLLSASRPDMSDEVTHLIDRCLAKKPEDRPTAAEIHRTLLPPLEAELPWPPPGLYLLGADVRRVRLALLGVAVGATLLLVALVFPPEPTRLGANWWSQFTTTREVAGSTLGIRSAAPEPIDAPTFGPWRVTLVAGMIGWAGGLLALWVAAHPLLSRVWQHRRRGWRWTTLLDVCGDPDGRSGLLLAGLKEFGAVKADQRKDVLRLRRWTFGATGAAILWLVISLTSWGVLVLSGVVGGQSVGAIAGVDLLLVVAVPPLLGLGAALYCFVREGRRLKPLPRRRRYSSAVSLGGRETLELDVTAWYAGLPADLGPQSPDKGGSPQRQRAAQVGWGALTIVGMLALTVVGTTTLVAGAVVRRLGPSTAEIVATIDETDEADPIGAARRAAEAYGQEARPAAGAESQRVVLASLLSPSSDVLAPSGALTRVGGPLLSSAAGGGALQTFLREASRLPPESLDLVVRSAGDPRVARLRDLARMPEVDILGVLADRPIGEYQSASDLPQPRYGALLEAASANAFGAVAAIARRDQRAAVARLVENAAVAGHLLREPSAQANRVGAIMLQTLSLVPLAELEESDGHQQEAADLRQLASAVQRHVFLPAWSTQLAGLAVDLHDTTAYARALRDTRLPPGVRADGLEGALLGFCGNPREIIRGTDARRELMVGVSAASMPDVRHAADLGALVIRKWGGGPERSGARAVSADFLQSRGLVGWWKRLTFCARF